MTRTIFTATSRTAIFALGALVLAALPQAASAQETGTWKVDPARSELKSSGFASLIVHRERGASEAPGRFVVVSEGKLYLVTGAAAATQDSRNLRPVDYTAMTQSGSAVLIGTHVQVSDLCKFGCVGGRLQQDLRITFQAVNGGPQIDDVLAYAAH